MTNNKFSHWYILLLLAAVVPIHALLLQNGILLQHDIFASDLLHSAFPYRAFLGKYIAEGTFPLWMPDVFSGAPFLPQIEAGPLFVPNWVLFGLFDPYVALNLSIVLTFLLGAAGTFFLARVYGADNISASLAGVIFALCGFNVSHIKHMSMHEAAAFLPWMILCLEQILRAKSHLWYVLLSLLIAGQIAAGHPQITYYSLLFLAARFLFHVLGVVRSKRSEGRKVVYAFVRKGLGLSFAALLAVGICALQLLTTYKFNQTSIRAGGLDWEFASSFPYHLRDILTFVYPAANGMTERFNYQGTLEWENYGYVGVIPLVMVALSLLLIKRKTVQFYLAATIVSMLLVVGPATPFYRLMWEVVPGMKLFRFPTRFLLIVDLSAAILCAVVLTDLAKRFLRNRTRSLVRAVLLVIFILAFADLYYWQRIKMPIDDLDRWRGTDPVVSAIKRADGDGRIYCLLGPEIWRRAFEESRGFLRGFDHYRLAGQMPFGNLSAVHDLPSADGYTNMLNQRTGSFWQWYNVNLLTHPLQPTIYDFRSNTVTDEFESLLNIAHVTHIVSPVILKNEGYELLRDGPIKVYDNKMALPRAYLAYGWKHVRDIEEAARWMFEKRNNVRPAIEGDNVRSPNNQGAITEVNVDVVSPSTLEFEVYPQAECHLVVAESFDPGWTAEIDGERATIYVANGYQQAVKVKPSSRKVVFRYRPEGFYIGAVISILSVLGLFVWSTVCAYPLLFRLWRSHKGK